MSRQSFGEKGLNTLMYAVVELLERKANIVKDQDLFNAIKTVIPDVSFSEFNKALMNLEMDGIIEVDTMKRNTRVIRLVR